MGVMEKTSEFVELLGMDSATSQDIYAKYALLADAYAGSSGIKILTDNQQTFEELLSTNMIDYMLYLQASGSLAGELANSPNLIKILDRSNPIYIGNIAKKLSSDGWNIKKETSLANIKTALSLFGIQSTDTLEGAEVINNTTDEFPNISFDDDSTLEEELDTSSDEQETPYIPEVQFDNIDPDDILDEAEQAARELDEDLIKQQVAVEEAEKFAQSDGAVKEFSSDNEDEVRRQIEKKDQQIQEYLDAKKRQEEQEMVEKTIKSETEGKHTVDKAIVTKTVKTIMSSYDVLYAHLFQETPTGILTSAGIVTVKSDNALQLMGDGNAYAISLYSSIMSKYGSVIRELDYHEEISTKCINDDGSLKYNYIPNFHIRNIYGIYRGEKDNKLHRETNWTKFRSHLLKSLTKYVTDLLESFKGDPLILSVNLIELFTTVFIMEDFDVNKSLKMSMKSMSINTTYGSCSDIGKMVENGMAFPLDTSTLEVVNNSEDVAGVHNLLVVFDKKLYNGEILFAYKPLKKILESGGRIGLQQTLLGRDIKGRNVTYNFESPQAVDSLIIAGSGSGKGVVTLNILATFIAEGCPTVYVDWKPDMAAMLWDLERATGARILAIDGLNGAADGVTPVRNYGVGIGKPKIPNISDKLNIIPYIKAFQLMILCAKGRNMNYNGMSSRGKKMQFILDEAQAMNKSLSTLNSEIEQFLKENKPKKGEQLTDEYRYVKKLKSFLDSMFSASVEFRNTTGRTGNVGLIMLGQQSDCSAWANGALKRDPIGFLVGNCSMKMLGKDATDTNKYSLNGCVPAGNSLLGNMGYFALVPQAVADKGAPDKIKVVKTYLVLNENDYSESGEGKFTGGMLKNVTDPVLRDALINEDFYPEDENGNRYVNPLVGFKGLIQYIGSTIPGFSLNDNLEAGYREVDKLLSGLGITGEAGKYSCVEEYLFDCSYDGLFTIPELGDLMQSNETIADLVDMGEDGAGGFGDEAPDSFSVIGVDEEEKAPKQNLFEQTGQTQNQGIPDIGAVPPINPSQLPRDVAEAIRRSNAMGNPPVQPSVHVEESQPHYAEQSTDEQSQMFSGDSDTGWTGDVENSSINDSQADQDYSDYQQEVEGQPEYMPPNEHKTFDFGGKTGRAIYVTPERTTQVLGLTKDNSVLVTMPTYSTAERFHKKLFGTLWGSQYEFKNRWRAILDGVAGSSNPNLITRLIIMEDTVVFNKKQVATLNILGGADDIRIEDIVNFGMTAKKYKNIRELMIDEVIFERAQIEFGDPIGGLFKAFGQLQRLTVVTVGCGAAKISVSRQELMQGRIDAKAQEAVEKAQFKNQMEAVAAAKNPNLHTRSPGYQSKVWEASKKFQGQGWGAARDALMDKNPKLFKAAGMGIVSLGVLGVGAVFGLAGRVGSLFARR